MTDGVPETASQPERPFGRVAVGIEITDAEHTWLAEVLQILDQEPPFDQLPDAFRRATRATPGQPLGILHSFSKQEDRPKLSIWPWQSVPGQPSWIIDVTSLGIDIGALAALIAIVAPSALTSSLGFPYTPIHDRNAPIDPQSLTGDPSGGSVKITYARTEILDFTLPLDTGIGRWVYPTPP